MATLKKFSPCLPIDAKILHVDKDIDAGTQNIWNKRQVNTLKYANIDKQTIFTTMVIYYFDVCAFLRSKAMCDRNMSNSCRVVNRVVATTKNHSRKMPLKK